MSTTTTNANTNTKEVPMLMSVHDLQAMGMGRSMAYQLLNRADTPVIKIGERKFMLRDKFYAWLEAQTPDAAAGIQ